MRTWFDYDTDKWVSERPKRYYVNLCCINTNEKIYIGDTISICQYRWVGNRFEEYRITITLSRYDVVSYNEQEQKELKPILISHNSPRKAS